MSTLHYTKILSLLIVLALAACSGEDYASEDDFLKTVRESAEKTSTEQETGAVGPGDGQTPIIEVETTSYSMGNVPADRVTTKSMKVFNRGEVPLIISDVKTSCFCTEGEMASNEIDPGKSADLRIHFHPDRVPGQFQAKKKLTIFSNDPKMPQLGVMVETKIDPELQFKDKILTIPSIGAGQATEGYNTIFRLQEKPIKFSNAALSTPMEFMVPSIVYPPKSEWADPDIPEIRILVKVDETAPVGRHKNMVRMTTDLVRFKKITIPVEVTIKGKFTLNPDAVTLRNILPGKAQKKILTVESQFPVSLTNLEHENTYFEFASRTNEDTGDLEIDLTIPEHPANRLQKDNLVLTLNVDGEEFTNTVRVVALLKSN
jgi:hypothetical protein